MIEESNIVFVKPLNKEWCVHHLTTYIHTGKLMAIVLLSVDSVQYNEHGRFECCFADPDDFEFISTYDEFEKKNNESYRVA